MEGVSCQIAGATLPGFNQRAAKSRFAFEAVRSAIVLSSRFGSELPLSATWNEGIRPRHAQVHESSALAFVISLARPLEFHAHDANPLFAGFDRLSGSSAIAALCTGRGSRSEEPTVDFVDAALASWAKPTGRPAETEGEARRAAVIENGRASC